MDARLTALQKILSNLAEDTVDISEIKRDKYGAYCFGTQEWLVLTDEEAPARAAADIEDSVWAFRPEFLATHSDVGAEIFKLIQDSGKCEDLNGPIKKLIRDWDHFVADAIKADGRGHFIASYDSEEHEAKVDGQWFFAYRVN